VEGESSQPKEPLLSNSANYKPLPFQGTVPNNAAHVNLTIHTTATNSLFSITMPEVYYLNWMSLKLYVAPVPHLDFAVKLGTMRSPCQTIHLLDLTGAVTVEVFLCTSRMISHFVLFPLVLLV